MRDLRELCINDLQQQRYRELLVKISFQILVMDPLEPFFLDFLTAPAIEENLRVTGAVISKYIQ